MYPVELYYLDLCGYIPTYACMDICMYIRMYVRMDLYLSVCMGLMRAAVCRVGSHAVIEVYNLRGQSWAVGD